MTHTATDDKLPQRLADEFSGRIRDALNPQDMAEVLRRNGTLAAGVCATHDFRDANLDMAEAFSTIVGREPAANSAADAALCSAAWALSKNAQFPRTLDLRQDANGASVYAFTIRDICIVEPRLSEDFFHSVDPESYYGLRPEELAAFDHANAFLRRSQRTAPRQLAAPLENAADSAIAASETAIAVIPLTVWKAYPVEVWQTACGCHALRIKCHGGSYILITENDHAQIPPSDATEVDLGRYAANGDQVESERALPVTKLFKWIDDALSRAKYPRNVADYFVMKLGAPARDDTLRDLPVDSVCAQDCVKAINAAAELCEHVREGFGESMMLEPLIEIARQVVGVYWRG